MLSVDSKITTCWCGKSQFEKREHAIGEGEAIEYLTCVLCTGSYYDQKNMDKLLNWLKR